MKKQLVALFFVNFLITSSTVAGPGHEHEHGSHNHSPISKTEAATKAEKRLQNLVQQGKIPQSWGGKKVASVSQKTFKGKQEWVVTFSNPKIADENKQTLYMFFRLDGHYLATNYSGN
ncbi:MAG: DUF6488 family protein [Gammaproteobacteria bacterium]|nr:DUF6488 family protein [Gammaproteobacteria bacterium]MDH5728590.1 DUF6488 family protein [Gammaproteobacteria bacterium]